MLNQKETYLPLLENYLSEVQIYKNKVDLSGVFLPHTLPKYETAKKKYFYCGQDTYWWIPFDKMIQYFENQDISGYIDENNAWPRVEDIIKYSNNKEGNFWTLVIRLHLYLHNREFANINDLSENDIEILQELGWGNINAVEMPRSLENEGRWDALNKDYYWDIKGKSKGFDSIKYILDVFDPDYIFIFNWDNNKEEDVFKGLNPRWNEHEYWDKTISTYNFAEYKAKVIWCPHPNNLRFKSMNIKDLIEEIEIRL
jgi:hypothetical protein